jgi:hypothetical protein
MGPYYPVVIMISNDADLDLHWGVDQAPARRVAGELLTPFRALVQTREARRALSRNLLREFVVKEQGGMFIWIRPWPSPVAIPLGWTLSEPAKSSMLLQLMGTLTTLQMARDKPAGGVDVLPTAVPCRSE